MVQFLHALNVFLSLVYATSLALYISYFYSKKDIFGKLASRTLITGILLHGIYLGSKWIYFKAFPIDNWFTSLSVLALSISIVYYILESRVKEGRTGLFFLSIVFIFQLIAAMFIVEQPIANPLLADPRFGIHTIVTLLGISSLAVSALYGLMYIMLAKEIKHYQFGAIYSGLPSLEVLEIMGRYATAVGIILLGLGIFLGHLWAYKVFGVYFKPDPKIIVTDITWIFYATGWLVVRLKRLHGLPMSLISLWGFILFFLSMAMVNILATSFHNFI